MRQRIGDVAASRDLSDEEIKPALTLKHHEIGRFSEQHGVSLEWLLAGEGRIFKEDANRAIPIVPHQQIRAMVDEVLQERDQ